MTTPPVWAAELAGRFWAAAGPPGPFPRDLRRAAVAALPLSLVDRPGLRAGTVTDFLRRQGLPAVDAGPDRPLRAALYCWRGAGFVFLDPDDPADERRFSLAHELAHFLRDYDAARRRAVKALGPGALAVLDGTRPATPGERLQAVLRACPLAPHAHFMGRDPAGRPAGPAERDAEARADRLAFELLAPAAALAGGTDPAAVADRLAGGFGLPAAAARRYAAVLLPPAPPAGSLIDRLNHSG